MTYKLIEGGDRLWGAIPALIGRVKLPLRPLSLSASDVAQKFLDVGLHAVRMIEQAFGGIENFV